MALKPTIISPGVELIEIDESLRATVPSGTTVFIPGFAPQGPTDEVLNISKIDEFETIFGIPTNAAERYFHQTVKLVLASAANVMVSRLPYGTTEGYISSKQYTLLAYPVAGYKLKKTTSGSEGSQTVTYSYVELNTTSSTGKTGYEDGSDVEDTIDPVTKEVYRTKDTATFIIGEPVQFSISLEDYYKILTGDLLTWENVLATKSNLSINDLGKFAFFTINVRKSVTNERYEGYYLGLSDNSFFGQELNGETYYGYHAIEHVKTVTNTSTSGITGDNYAIIPGERFNFKLSGPNTGSVSHIMQTAINNFDISAAQWNDTLNFGIFKIREATGSDALKLAAVLTDGFNASLETGRKTPTQNSAGLEDFFIEKVTADSKFFNVFVNPYFSDALSNRGLNSDGTPKIKVRVYSDWMESQLIDVTSDTEAAQDLNKIFNTPFGILKSNISDINTKINKADSLYPLGLYSNTVKNDKVIGNVPQKLSKALELITNEEIYNIDLLLDAGLSTIYTSAIEEAYKNDSNIGEGEGKHNAVDSEQCIFDDTKTYDSITALRTSKTLNEEAKRVFDNFNAVHATFLTLACSQQEGGRGDVFYIGDGLRQVTVEGKNTKVDSKYGISYDIDGETSKVHSFSTSIYWAFRQLFSNLVSSYMAVYPHFIKYNDINSGNAYWYPSSGAVAAKMATTDALYGPWQAAAGRTNGILTGALDISFTTNQRQRDDLYKISLNCLNATPSNGTLVWGIRTMIKKDSVFDQITCRRTFLYLEKMLRSTSTNFLFEGNTDFTRLKVINTIDPVLQSMVNARALYDYVLICDTRNNTPDVIDDGNMRIDLYASPVRTAERILIAVHATKSGTITTEFDV